MPPLVIAAIALAAGAAYKGGKGAAQKAKAKKLAASNKRPDFAVPEPYKDNQALTESMAGYGLSSSAKQAYLSNADRGLTSSIDAILKSGGDPNLVSGAYDNYEQGISRMALAEDDARLKHVGMYLAANQDMGAMLDKQWGINKYAPFADKAQAAAQLAATGEKNINGAVDMAVSAVSMGANAYAGAGGAKAAGATKTGANAGNSQFTSALLGTMQNRSGNGYGVPQSQMGAYGTPNNMQVPGYAAAPATMGAWGTPTNLRMTPYYNSSGYVPDVTPKASINMQSLGMSGLGAFNQVQAPQNQTVNNTGIDYNSLLLTQWE